MKYRKRPVVIEAVQWTGHNTDDIVNWILSSSGNHFARWRGPERVANKDDYLSIAAECIEIKTLEGLMRADLGDWIICGVKGEFYPCKPEVFGITYDPFDESSNTQPTF